MYYSYKCTYCGRLFYTYNRDKHHAANTLYHTIKTHLRDYNEDHKEYQMDDGEHTDTEQVYHEMHTHSDPPRGGYRATGHSLKTHEQSTHNSTTPAKTSHSAVYIVVFLFLILLGIAAAYYFVPEVEDFFTTFIVPQQ